MHSPVTNITITQQPKTGMETRTRVIRLGFVNYYSWDSRWTNQTDNGKIVIPRNVVFKDENNTYGSFNGKNFNVGGFVDGVDPLIMRGDRVQLEAGYKYQQPSMLRTVDDTAVIMDGYISRVYSRTPIEFDVEDSMWILKQTPMSGRTFTRGDKLEDVLALIVSEANTLHGTMLTHNTLTETEVGCTLIVGNETAAQLLDRLKRLYGFHAYFRGTELRCGVFNYIPSDATRHIFIMNGEKGNVCAESQQLEYQRKEDLSLSAIAHSTIVVDGEGQTKDGQQKTKRQRLEVLVEYRNGQVKSKVIEPGTRAPEATEGERRTFFFPEATTTDQLIDLATKQLAKYYYSGLKGKFMTLGIPYVRHGDEVDLRNPMNREQDGIYKVRGVEYTGGMDGIRQIIELDYKI